MSEENVEIARRGYAAFNLTGIDGILDSLDEDIEWRTWERFVREPRVYRGHAGVREVLRIFTENFDEFSAEPQEFIDAGERVVVPVKLSGRAKGTGEPASFELVHVWTAAATGGRAARLDVYSSKAEALEAVGMASED